MLNKEKLKKVRDILFGIDTVTKLVDVIGETSTRETFFIFKELTTVELDMIKADYPDTEMALMVDNIRAAKDYANGVKERVVNMSKEDIRGLVQAVVVNAAQVISQNILVANPNEEAISNMSQAVIMCNLGGIDIDTPVNMALGIASERIDKLPDGEKKAKAMFNFIAFEAKKDLFIDGLRKINNKRIKREEQDNA